MASKEYKAQLEVEYQARLKAQQKAWLEADRAEGAAPGRVQGAARGGVQGAARGRVQLRDGSGSFAACFCLHADLSPPMYRPPRSPPSPLSTCATRRGEWVQTAAIAACEMEHWNGGRKLNVGSGGSPGILCVFRWIPADFLGGGVSIPACFEFWDDDPRGAGLPEPLKELLPPFKERLVCSQKQPVGCLWL